MCNSGSRSGVPKIGIIMTDGKSNSKVETLSAAKDSKSEGILLFSIGIGSSTDSAELRGIANDPDSDFYFTVNDFKALKSIESSLASKACTSMYIYINDKLSLFLYEILLNLIDYAV